MKKFSCALLAVALFFMGTTVNAMTEDDLKAKLTQGFDINGKVVKLEDYHVAELERYLDKYEVNSKDAKYISDKIDEAVDLARRADATSFTDLTAGEVKDAMDLVAAVSKDTSVKASLTKGGKLTIYEKDGKTPFTVIADKDNGIQNTNNNYFIIVIASVISLLGIVVITKNVAKANA